MKRALLIMVASSLCAGVPGNITLTGNWTAVAWGANNETVLEITDGRPWLRFDGAVVVCVTEAEMAVLMRAYPEKVQRTNLSFVKANREGAK